MSFARVRQEGEGGFTVWVAAYTRIFCLGTDGHGSCSYKYKVLVMFRVHFW